MARSLYKGTMPEMNATMEKVGVEIKQEEEGLNNEGLLTDTVVVLSSGLNEISPQKSQASGATTRTVSSVNAPRSSEDNKKFWGGKMVDSVQAVEGNISLFSDECLSVHGLYDAFYSRNGWCRTLVYLMTWVCFGYFFFWLTIPQLRDYNSRAVSTHIYFEDRLIEGLPLPIITVCPHGSGVRCDCHLWRRLYCRYLDDLRSSEWRQRFSIYGCPADFNRTGMGEKVWVDPQCDTLNNPNSTVVDPCYPTAREIEALPSVANLTGETLFDEIVRRETSDQGPYITQEELMLYASRRDPGNVHFFLPDNLGTYGALPKAVPREWERTDYFEMSRLQMCSHFRAPSDQMLMASGAQNGVVVVITHIKTDLYTIDSAGSSSAAVDIHINTIKPSDYINPLLPVAREMFFPVSAGVHTELEYSVESLQRKQGFGSTESRKCEHSAVPRQTCIELKLYDLAFARCECASPQYLPNFPLKYAGCSSTRKTPQHYCLQRIFDVASHRRNISLEECPTQCEGVKADVNTHSETQLSPAQVEYAKRTIQFNNRNRPAFPDDSIVQSETAIIQIGPAFLFTTTYKEEAKVAIGALLGQIGGNAGLWCGLSFVLMLELLEFVIVALLYGSGFYSGGHKALRDHIRGFFMYVPSLFKRQK